MTDTAYIDGEDNLRGAKTGADGKIDWNAWLNNRKKWLDGVKKNANHSFSSARQKLKNVDFERVSDKFESAALGLTANALTPMLTGMATMALVKAGLVALGAPVAIVGIGFAAWSMTRSFVKAREKYNEDRQLAESKGEEAPSFGFKYWWPFALKGLSTAIFMGLGVMVAVDWDVSAAADVIPNPDGIDGSLVDDVPEVSLLNNDVEDVDNLQPVVNEVEDVDLGTNVEPVQIDDAVSYDVEFGSNFELPESPTAVDRIAAMMPDDASPEVIEALEAARDGHVWGVHNLAYHLSFEHGGLELDEAGKQLVLDLYAEAASEGHQLSIDNLATLENMWGMEAEGFDTPAVALGNVDIIDGDGSYSTLDLNSREELRGDSMAHYGGVDDDTLADDQPSVIDTYLASLEDGAPNPYDVVEVSELPDIVDDQPSVIDMYVASLADDAPNPYDVIEVSDLPPIEEPVISMADVGGPIDLTVNLGASLADMPEGYVPEVASLGVDDGVSYGSAPVVENTQLADGVSNVDLNDEPEQVVAAIPAVATCDLSSGTGAASAFNVQCSIDQDDWVQGSEILINDNRGAEPVSYAFINNNADSKDTATTLRAMFNGDAPQRWLAAVEDLQEVEPNNVQYASVGGPDRPLTP